MPLETGEKYDTSFFGTNADGTIVKEYCRFCFSLGKFSEPELTLDDMLKKSIGHMTRVLQFPEAKAKEMAQKIIPQLKRWNHKK